MIWPSAIAAALLLLLGAGLASRNAERFRRRIERDGQELLEGAGEVRAIQRSRTLPAPVRRYLDRALGARTESVRALRVLHGGTFRPSLDGPWLPIRGEQYFSADPPGFVWWGRVRVGPGVWVDAHDRLVSGRARMFVALESTLPIAERHGHELDQSALLRLLGEMVWFPSSLADERFVLWSAIDDRHARATLRLNRHEVSAVFEFGDDDLVRAIHADRHREVSRGKSVLTPFSGQYSDFRSVGGMLVPHRVDGYWHVNGRALGYARFSVERLEFFDRAPEPVASALSSARPARGATDTRRRGAWRGAPAPPAIPRSEA